MRLLAILRLAMLMRVSRRLRLMGTLIDLFVEGDQADLLCQEAEVMLHRYHQRFSANSPFSELAAVNHAAGEVPVTVHEDLFELLTWGKLYSDADLGFLNIAMGSVTALWRIGFNDARLPEQDEIVQALRLTDRRDIVLDHGEKTVYLKKKGMRLDLGALAKGFIADKVMAYWKSYPIRAAMINLGGNVLVHGKPASFSDEFWRVGIQHPEQSRGQHVAVLKLQDASVVTSGSYERHLFRDGQSYHHIFDPNTGYPIVSDIRSISLISKQSLLAETWTSILFGYSPKTAIEIVDTLPELEGLVIAKDGAIWQSKGLKPYLCL